MQLTDSFGRVCHLFGLCKQVIMFLGSSRPSAKIRTLFWDRWFLQEVAGQIRGATLSHQIHVQCAHPTWPVGTESVKQILVEMGSIK
ncbi:hypothetical protein TNCT_197831 [Trichonephila clavata]|uniref:Uncharacterized protein n=1 Tax=Trichonephila clavata TaxID=2740835 RepID=A0A8X6M3T2_TRICU|nr:hypothetical protein TNCT_197831 [Trichonephila clavata]